MKGGMLVKRFIFCYCGVVNRDDFVKWGATGGRTSAKRLGAKGRSQRAKRGWRTRKNGKAKQSRS